MPRTKEGYDQMPNDQVQEVDTNGTAVMTTGTNDVQIPVPSKEIETSGDSKDSDDSKSKKDDGPPPVGFFTLFRFASCFDKCLILIACLVSIASGGTMPVLILFLGDIIESFITEAAAKNGSYVNVTVQEKFMEDAKFLSFGMVIMALIVIVFSYIMVMCLVITAENQAFRIRTLFMNSILRQDIGWFDTHQTGDFASRTTADLTRIQDGIGEKVGLCLMSLSTGVVAVLISLYYGWKLTLVILSAMPILMIASIILAKIQSALSGGELSAYGNAGAVAEEVLSSIRTVVAFGGEEKEIKRYVKELAPAKRNGIKRGLITAIGLAIMWFCIYASYGLAFWYGVKLILDSKADGTYEYTPSNLMIVFFNVLTATMFMGQAAPYFEAFSLARGAAANIFDIIARVSLIDSQSEEGSKPEIKGHVYFKDIHFHYPSRSDVPILKGLTLEAKPGETVALVGPSGCGKSTVIQLLQRFYDPVEGQVLVDGTDIREMNVGWLRDHIGVVGQEPVLFATTISENIRYGFLSATQEQIEKAAKDANAHDFIMKFPDKYETSVGQRGAQMSGGQKQRIAIARALVKDPKILLLDEATSALDMQSESVVQAALDRAREGRTTFIVAHRLSTIQQADKIAAVKDGVIEEIGTHAELMQKQGLYYQLVTSQQVAPDEDFDDDEEEEQQVVKHERSRLVSQASLVSNLSHGSGGDDTPQVREETYVFPKPKKEKKPPQSRLLKMAIADWPYITFGCLCSFLMGFSVPVYAVVFGEILATLSDPDDEKVRRESSWYSLLFVLIGVASGIASFFQSFLFIIAGEKLTQRVRKECFIAQLRQEIGWYDQPENSTGALCSRLSSDAASIQGAVGTRLSTISQSISTFIAALFIALYFNWKIGLVSLVFVPLVVIAAYFQSNIMDGQVLSEKEAREEATKIAVEAISSIRTVASIHQENTFYTNYVSALLGPHKSAKRKSHLRGIILGFAQSIPSLAYATAMFYGSVLIYRNELEYGDLFKILEGVVFGTAILGQTVAYAPDYDKAKVAAVNIFKLLDRQPLIDAFSSVGEKPADCSGRCDFKSVRFRYPTRPDAKILRNLNLHIQPGQTVALVGSSGCGKSTIIQLLQRFYDSDRGEVRMDGHNIVELNLPWLRGKLGSVSQEPVLFSYSIAENIAYGDNTRKVPMEEIIEAAKQANIHNFIQSLPAGYDTHVGSKGSQLSGGQKQRIAIARALVRNPQVLLLDEATSALDTESEKVVQEALDKAMSGRTSIVIAHRLSTIQNADKICVIHHGRVVEEGTHQELLSKRCFYHKLYSLQANP